MNIISLADLLEVIYKRRSSIYIIIVSIIAITLILSLTLPKVYRASASIFRPENIDSLNFSLSGRSSDKISTIPIYGSERLLGAFVVLNSNRLAEIVANKIPGRTVRDLKKNTYFKISKKSIFTINAFDRDPNMVSLIANTYAESFDELFRDYSFESAKKARIMLEMELERTDKELLAAQNRLKEFQEGEKTVSLQEETSSLIKASSEFRSLIDSTKVSLQEVNKKIRSIEGQLAQEEKMQLSSEVVTDNPIVKGLRQKLTDLEIGLASLKAKFHDKHPEIVRINSEIEHTKKLLEEEVIKIVDSRTFTRNSVYETLRQNLSSLYVDQEALDAKLKGLNGVVTDIDERIMRLPELNTRLTSLTSEIDKLSTASKMLANKLEEARIQEIRENKSFVVLDRAIPPANPSFPALWLNLFVALPIGFVVSIFYCFVLEYIEKIGESKISGLKAPELEIE